MASMVESALAPAPQQMPGQAPMQGYQPPAAVQPFQGYQSPQFQRPTPYGANQAPQYGAGAQTDMYGRPIQPQQQQGGFYGYGQERMQGQGQPQYNLNAMPTWSPTQPPPPPGPPQAPQGFAPPPQQPMPQPTGPETSITHAQLEAQREAAMGMNGSAAHAQLDAARAASMQQSTSGWTGSALASSDRTMKTIEKKTLADAFLESLKPYSYKYKDKHMEPRVMPTGGTYLGVMAQDLEKIPEVGHQLVVDTPAGKMVDQKTALSAVMAGLGRVVERLRAVEEDMTTGTMRGRGKPKVKAKE